MAPIATCALDSFDAGRLQDQQLLWIDVGCDDADLLDGIGRKLGLPDAAIAALQRLDSTPRLDNHGDCFALQAVAVEHEGALKFTGTVLGIAAGPNFVLSVHHRPIAFIEQLRERERGESELGALGAESFTASLLDWQLSTYFEAVSDFEAAVERLEVEILSDQAARVPARTCASCDAAPRACGGCSRRIARCSPAWPGPISARAVPARSMRISATSTPTTSARWTWSRTPAS